MPRCIIKCMKVLMCVLGLAACTANAAGGKQVTDTKRSQSTSSKRHFRGVMFSCGVSRRHMIKSDGQQAPWLGCVSAKCAITNYFSVRHDLRYRIRGTSRGEFDLGVMRGDGGLSVGLGFDGFEDCLGASPSIFTQQLGSWFKASWDYSAQGRQACVAYMPISTAGVVLGTRAKVSYNVVLGAAKISSPASDRGPVFSCGAGCAVAAVDRALVGDFRAIADVSMYRVKVGTEVAYANSDKAVGVTLSGAYHVTPKLLVGCSGKLGSYVKNLQLGYSRDRLSVGVSVGATDRGYLYVGGRIGFAVASEFK